MRDASFMTGPFNPGAGRAISLGEALAMGLAQGTNSFIQTNNTFEQQRQQQANILQDQQFRAQQAEEQRRQFEAQARQQRDTQAFQWLGGQQQQLTQILAKGGFAKGSPEYMAAEAALQDTNKLMRRVLSGETLPPEEMERYDTVLSNVAAITAAGAGTLGGRVEAREGAELGSIQAGTTATTDANARANELQPFGVANAGIQNRLGTVEANVAEGTQGAMIARPELENQGLALRNQGQATENDVAGRTADFRVRTAGAQTLGAEVAARVAQGTEGATIARAGIENELLGTQLGTARWQLGDLQTKAPLVYEGLRLSNAGAQQALDFNAEMQPEKMVALRQQNEQTRQQIDQSAELFPWQKRGLTAQVNVQEAQAEIVQATKAGTISRQNAESWATLAREVRDPAAFDELVKDGVMTAEQAEPFKRLAGYYRDSAGAALDQARAGARTATSQANVAEGTEGAAITTANAQARTAGAQADVAEGTVAPTIRTANAQATTAESGARVAVQTEGAAVRTANAQAEGAEVGVETAQFSLERARALFPTELGQARTALETAQEQLAAFREGRPYNLALLKANVATVEQALSQNAALFGPRLQEARLQVRALQSEVRVAEGTEGARVSTANDQAALTAAQRTQVESTLTSTIAALNSNNTLTVKTNNVKARLLAFEEPAQRAAYLAGIAKTGPTGQAVIRELARTGVITPDMAAGAGEAAGLAADTMRAEATDYGNRAALSTMEVQKVDLTLNSTIRAINTTNNLQTQTNEVKRGLLQLEGASSRAEFLAGIAATGQTGRVILSQLAAQKVITPAEANAGRRAADQAERGREAALTVSEAQATAATTIGPDGNSVTDKKTLLGALDSMRKINADERRLAATNLQNTMRRLLPNAKFSIDKYDPKSFTTLVGSASNLTSEQRQELQTAQLAYDNANSKAQDLSNAFASVSGRGRIDPAVAERLGIYDPEEAGDPNDPYGSKQVGNVAMVTRFPGTSPIPASLNGAARAAISRTAGRLGIDPNALAAVISFETAGTFSPSAKNPNSSGSGLIQFMESTAKGMGTTTAALRAMSFPQQMEYVERYLKGRGIGPGSTIADVYAAVTGSGFRRGTDAYELNKVWDANGNGVIEKGEQVLSPQFQAHVRNYFAGNRPSGPAAPAASTTGGGQDRKTEPPKATIAGQAVPASVIPRINSAIQNLASTPMNKRAGQAQIAAQAIARELQKAGVKGVTTQQVLAFLGSTGGKPL